MDKKVRSCLEMFERGDQFAAEYTARFAEGSVGAQAFTKLRIAAGAIKNAASARVTHVRAGRDQKPPARQALLRQLDEIAFTARLIGESTPGFAEPFVLPRPKRDDVIVATAKAFLRDAEPVAARFTQRGLPASFLDDLQTALATFEQALAVKSHAAVARGAAQAAIRRAVADGRAAVKEIDLIIRYRFADDEAMQEAWKRARRVHRIPQEPEAPATAPAGDGNTVIKPAA